LPRPVTKIMSLMPAGDRLFDGILDERLVDTGSISFGERLG
jgi:hypothetical protein